METFASLSKYSTSLEAAGTFENQILYRMCEENPSHEHSAVVSGKIISIGRVYAASPERSAGKKRAGLTESITHLLAKRLCDSEIDDRLTAFGSGRIFEQNLIPDIVETHAYLIGELHSALVAATHDVEAVRSTRSFASKYLHFHRPDVFPIFDSLAAAGLRSLPYQSLFPSVSANCDRAYVKFCATFADLVSNEYASQPWTLRSVDTRLVAEGRKAK